MGTSNAAKNIRHQTHAVPQTGRTLINRIEAQMDRRREIMQDMVVKHGMEDCLLSTVYVANKGRYEGFAGALAILRSTTMKEEVARSNERLGIS